MPWQQGITPCEPRSEPKVQSVMPCLTQCNKQGFKDREQHFQGGAGPPTLWRALPLYGGPTPEVMMLA
jgi:hypothetical protein